MLEKPGDVAAPRAGQEGLALAVVESRPIPVRQVLVVVKARPGLPVHGLGHEDGDQTALRGEVADDPLCQSDAVGGPQQGHEVEFDLELTRRSHLVVVVLDGDADTLQHGAHFRADVFEPVLGRGGMIASPVSPVFGLARLVAHGGRFTGEDLVARVAGVVVDSYGIEQVELQFREPQAGFTIKSAGEVLLGLPGHIAAVPGKALPRIHVHQVA